ncbi:MAG TPA: choice-of-anchor B family protein [Candidatus Marinimicrobia bacterium]|nr:choice-of-anchor B family protein [Candidatus Neomarinimicrobiota bacterium]
MKKIQTFRILISLCLISAAFSEIEYLTVNLFNISESREADPELYWEWEPEPRWLSGVNWGGSTFFEYIGFGEDFLGSTLSIDDAIGVEIRFDSGDTTLCQTFRRDLGYDAAGVGIFRGSAWDISDPDNHRRLNICFVEWDDGTGEHDPNHLWDPDDSNYGRREYLLIMLSDYDGTGETYANNSGYNSDVVYSWWPKLRSGYSFFETDPAALRIQLAYITNFSSLPDDGQLTLSWEFEEGGIDHFDLYYSFTGQPDVLLAQLAPEIREYVHTGLTNDEKVYYQLKGVGSNGDVLYYSQQIWGEPHPIAQNMSLFGTWDNREKYGDIWGYTDANTGIEYALICARDEGLSIIDITDDPPVEVGFVPSIEPGNDAKDVKVYDHYAILIKEYEPAQVINLADPADPVVVSTIHFGDPYTDGGAHNCYVDGQYLYAIGHDIAGFEIYDMSSPQSPTLVGNYDTYYYHDIYVQNGIAYAAAIHGEGVDIVDVSNFSQIQLLANLNYPGSGAHNCWTTEDGNYLIVGDEIGEGPWTRIFDIQDLDNITMVAEYIVDPEATVHNSYVKGNFLYVAHYTEGVRIVDLTNPAEPEEIAYYDTYLPNEYGYEGCWSVYPYFESGKIIASDLSSGLFVLEHHPPLGVNVPTLLNQFKLMQNYPNPFNPNTAIKYSLGTNSFVNLTIFDLSGNTIKTLVNKSQVKGIHFSQWNGLNENGNRVPSGMYFIKIKSGAYSQSRKMVFLK